MCLRYPQASSVATLPTGSILPPPPTPPNMAVYYPQHGCILPSAPKTKKNKKKNIVDKFLWLNCECLFKKPVDTDYISGMKNNGCLLKEAHQESWFIDVMID